jgi:Zn-finger nucleic acid-binding protein
MLCPVCKIDMLVIEYSKIELDYCATCQGVWFDSGELELLLKLMKLDNSDPLLKNMLDLPEAGVHEKRRCPICNQKMKEANIGEQSPLHIDVCQRGDGLWFDGDELGQLLKQLAQKQSDKQVSQQQIFSFLQEVFKARE